MTVVHHERENMSHLPTTLKRLAMALLGACLLMLGTPLLGLSPANAGTPSGPTVISIGGGLTNATTFNSGAKTTLTLLANTTVAGPGYPQAYSIYFAYTPAGGNYTGIGFVSSAPWTMQWSPPAALVGTSVTITAEAYSGSGTFIVSGTASMSVMSTGPSQSIASPGGSTITPDGSGKYVVGGYKSDPAYDTIVFFALRDNSTGVVGNQTIFTAVNTGTTWSASLAASSLPCPNPAAGGCDLVLTTMSAGNNTFDIRQWRIRPAYTQVRASIAVSPTAMTATIGSVYYATATVFDQNGALMSGQTVTLSKTATGANTAVLSPTSGTTDSTGMVNFSIQDNTSETTTVTATSGSFTAQLVINMSPLIGTFSTTPAKALSATPFTATLAGTGSTGTVGTEYLSTSPVVRLCFAYNNGSPADSSSAAITAKVNVSRVRTVKTGTTSTPGAATIPTLTQDQSANPGCYLVAHPAAGSEEEGTDAFTGYYNQDGVAGYSAGGGDVQVPAFATAWGQHKLTGATGSAQASTYGTATFSSKTPDGQSFAGRKLNIAITSPASSTLNPTQPTGTTYLTSTTATCLTSATGTCSVSVTDASVLTTTLTASDDITDATLKQVATGRWATAQVAFSLDPPTTGIVTATPAKPLYAVPFTGTVAGTGSGAQVGSEYAVDTQGSRVCFAYADGSPIDSSNTLAASKVFASATRTTKTGLTSTAGTATPATFTQDQSANPGCFLITRAAPGSEDSGSDTFTGYYNADATAGYQPGNGDVLATPLTVSWAQLKTTGSTSTEQKGRYATARFTSKTPDGRSFAGRQLTLSVTSPATSTLNPTQPAGTIYTNPTTAICTTDSNGGCAVSVTDANTVSTVLTATDDITSTTPAQVGTGRWGTANITFNSTPGGLDSLATTPVTVLQPSVNTGTARTRPGDIGRYSFTLLDNNGGPLASKSVDLTVSSGFFTPDCTSYATCTFNPAPGEGNTVGAAASSGKAITVTSNASGVFTFAVSIGRDAGLDATGRLAANLTVIGANGAATAPLDTFSTLGTAFANATTLAIVPFTPTDALSGSVASNGTNKIPGQTGLLAKPGSDFQLRLTDGFGNLATLSNCAVNLTLTPVGAQTAGSAPYLGSPGNTSANGCGSYTTTAPLNGIAPESFHLDSDNPSPTANAVLLTASWAIPWTRYTAVAGPPATTFTTTAGTATPLSASKQLSLYAMDQRTLTTVMSQTPGGTVQINTPVSVTAKVTDSAGNPLAGAAVTWQRSGPNDATGAPQTVGGTSTTSNTGTATFTFTSPTVGTAAIIAITKNPSGAELTRGTASTTFITGPTPTTSPTPTPTATATATGTASPSPSGTASPRPTATPTGTASPSPSPTATATPTATASPTPVPTSPAGSVVTISGGDWQTPVFNATFALTGTAPAGALVTLRFRKAGMAAGDYSLTRNIITPANGVWVRSIAAIFDYRFYATITTTTGLVSSGNVLFQPTVVVNGPLDVTTAKNLPYTITGKAAPYSLLYLHFHKAGTPAADYSIVRAVRTNSVGTWTRAILASSDYRYYASRNASDTPAGRANYRFTAR